MAKKHFSLTYYQTLTEIFCKYILYKFSEKPE